jgi:hypothetical protein
LRETPAVVTVVIGGSNIVCIIMSAHLQLLHVDINAASFSTAF